MLENHTWGELTSQVLALYARPMRRPATARKMRQVLLEFGDLVGEASDLTPATVARWIAAHPNRRPETVCALLRSLRAACVYGVQAKLLDASPFDFREPSAWVDWDVEELDPPVHQAEEIARVLALADQEASGGSWKAARLRALVYCYAFTGARKREVLALQTADIDLAAGVLQIRTNRRRGLKTRQSAACLPLPAPLGAVLAAWLPRTESEWLFPGIRRKGPWLEGPPGEKPLDQVKALGLRAGVPGLTIQSFRHTFASLSESWGIGELALQRVLRHSNLRTQRGYRHELPAVLRDTAAKVHFP
jgi:integrase